MAWPCLLGLLSVVLHQRHRRPAPAAKCRPGREGPCRQDSGLNNSCRCRRACCGSNSFGALQHPAQRFQPPAQRQGAKETVPPGAVGNLHGQFVVLAGDGRFEPVLEDQPVRHYQRRERFHGFGQPVGRLRIAEHDRIEIDCRPRGVDAAVAAAGVVFVDLLHVEQPERARPQEMQGLGQRGVAIGGLAGLIERGGLEEHPSRGEPAAGHGPVADGCAGVVQQGHRLLRLARGRGGSRRPGSTARRRAVGSGSSWPSSRPPPAGARRPCRWPTDGSRRRSGRPLPSSPGRASGSRR